MRSLALFLFASAALAAELKPLGALFELESKWKARAGDNPAWAAPQFDDSNWQDQSALAPQQGLVWFRQTMMLPPGNDPLALWIPHIVSAGEVYLQGERVLEFGPLDRWWLQRRDLAPPVAIPAALRQSRSLVIAVRVRQIIATRGVQGKVLLGDPDRVRAEVSAEALRVGRNTLASLVILVFPLVASVAFLIYWGGRRERMPEFWFATICLGYLASDLDRLRPWGIPQLWTVWMDALTYVAGYGAWRFFQGRERSAGWDRWQVGWAGAMAVSLVAAWLRRAYIVVGLEPVFVLASLVFFGLVVQTVAQRVRRGERDVLWLAVPYLLAGFADLLYLMKIALEGMRATADYSRSGMEFARFPLWTDPFLLDIGQVGQVLSVAVMSVVVTRGVLRLRDEKQSLEGELEAARQVQQLLVPASSAQVPGFAIESVYLPAQQVGGDFYLTAPTAAGGLLAVAGDVSGKGLRAAMVVSLVIGALRSRRSDEPGRILADLNQALVGQAGGGFVTCCCLRLDADGRILAANAGHPAPYADGQEAAMASGLPLGVMPEADYEETQIAGTAITLVSDGVVEATSASGELFGFERTCAASTKPAAEIAEAAKQWGQNDDITVVTVTRKA